MVATTDPGGPVRRSQQRCDLDLGEVADLGRVEPFLGDRQHAGDQFGLLWRFERRIVEERADRGQPGVAGPRAVGARLLQVGEELADGGGVEVFEQQLRGRSPGALVHEAQKQPEAVAVCGDGVGAGVALADEPVGEEPLQQGRQRGHGRCSQMSSSRCAASASSWGAAS